jgi:hypothetical protein
MVTVPQGRTRSFVKLAIADLEVVDMPERVLSPQMTSLGLNVRTLFDSTLAIANRHLFQSQLMLFEQRAFSFEMLIAYYLHI